MLDIVMPIPASARDHIPGCIEALLESTDLPLRVIAILDGGDREAVQEAQRALADVDHVLMHNKIPEGLNCCVQDAQKEIRQQMVVVMQPWVRLRDPKWFGKVQRIFQVDPICGVVDTLPNTASTSIAPVKRSTNRLPDPGCPFAIFNGNFFKRSLLSATLDPVVSLSRAALSGGGTAWHHGGVNYFLGEHKAWRESSAEAAPSKSRSQTTRASSTPTTTAPAGPTDFGL